MRAASVDRSDGGVDRAEVAHLELVPGVSVEVMQASYQRQVFPKHTHEYFTIGLALRGVGVVWFRGTEHVRRRGEVVVIPPGEVHTGGPAPDAPMRAYLAVHASPEVLALCAQAHDMPSSSPSNIAPAIIRDPAIGAAFRGLDAAMSAAPDDVAFARSPSKPAAVSPSIDGAAADAVSRALGLLVCRYADASQPSARECGEPELVRVVRQIIDDCYADNARTSLATLSAACGVTPFHVVRLFTRSVGISPHRYLVQTRVRRARELLAGGIAPSFVAAMTGFADQSHLTTQFKRFVGTTPGSYQRCVHATSRRS
jgi:AraC-like DNA-binding protein/quercetin dioxygenase-like cupin family protein